MSANETHEAVDPSGSDGWVITTPNGIRGFIDAGHSNLRVLTVDLNGYTVGAEVGMGDLPPHVRRRVQVFARATAFRPMD